MIIFNIIVIFLRFIWRIWFVVVSIISTLICVPFAFLAIFIKYHKLFFSIRKLWAKLILYGIGIPYKVIGEFPKENKRYVIIANHVSKLDAIFLCAITPGDLSFVGKKELARIPIFGVIYKATNITVNRSSYQSRKSAYLKSKELILLGGKLCIFPEGTVPDEHITLEKFKDGVFSLAVDTNTPILPIIFMDNKEYYPYNWLKGRPGISRIEIYNLIDVNSSMNKKKLKQDTYNFIKNKIIKN